MPPNAISGQDDCSSDYRSDMRGKRKDAKGKWFPYFRTKNESAEAKPYEGDCSDSNKCEDSDKTLPDCASKEAETPEFGPPQCKDDEDNDCQARDEECKDQSVWVSERRVQRTADIVYRNAMGPKTIQQHPMKVINLDSVHYA
jgi:hypothetical protein